MNDAAIAYIQDLFRGNFGGHDADDHKLFQTEGNANARSFLNAQKVAPEKIERICEAINAVSFSQNRGRRPETLEGKIVQDADRLDAIGAIGIARTFAYSGEHGRSLDASVAHFHEKLLLLEDELNTEAARRLAEPRHAFLERFLEEYERESGERTLWISWKRCAHAIRCAATRRDQSRVNRWRRWKS